METVKKQRKKTSSGAVSGKIEAAYKNYLLTHAEIPASVFSFCQVVQIAEKDFYNCFASLASIDTAIWKRFVTETISQLNNSKEFEAFTSREKMLAFYFALAERMKADRSYILFTFKSNKIPAIVPAFLRGFKSAYEEFVSNVLQQGLAAGEVANRPPLHTRYVQAFWVHIGLFLLFWRQDNSAGFEKTDAFIEKSTNLAFDLIGKGSIDSIIDFAKFLYQTSTKYSSNP